VALYLEHFGLTEPPFGITPHTEFFFEGADRGATLEALSYAVLHDEGIVKVSGEVGSGKTMLCRMLMERLPPEVATIYLATPSLAHEEILHAIADELDLRLSERRTVALRELQEHLIQLYGAGRRVVILIDEAHVMPEETLEQVRLLSNLESSRHKLLHLVLFGQPELDATLAKSTLRQLRDRITHSFRMRPLAPQEVTKYLSFRMRAAGYRGPELFAARAAALIARASGGLTRRINILADKALLAAYTEASHAVTKRHVRAAVADSEFAASGWGRLRPGFWFALAGAAGVFLGMALQWMLPRPEPHAQAPAPVQAVPAPQVAQGPRATSPEDELAGAEEAQDILAAELEALAAEDSMLSDGQRRRLDAYSGGGYKLLSQRLVATREILERTPDQRYAIELFVTDNTDPGRMERFLQRARDMVPLEQLLVIPTRGEVAPRLRVLYGDYDSIELAREAGRRLPPKYQREFRLSARSFGELRAQL